MRAKDVLGRWGEQVAADHLIAAGLEVIERNWRCPAGELDIIARDGHTVVFVEVKTRSSAAFGEPVEAVTNAKRTRLRALAVNWLESHRAEAGGWPDIRFDVIAVLRDGATVRHVRDAF